MQPAAATTAAATKAMEPSIARRLKYASAWPSSTRSIPRNQTGGAKYRTRAWSASRRLCAGSDMTNGSASTSAPIIALRVAPIAVRTQARGVQRVTSPFTAATASTANADAETPDSQNAIHVSGGASIRQRLTDISSTSGVTAMGDVTVKRPAKSVTAAG